MPYVNKVVRYEDVEKTMLFRGEEEKYMDRVPVEELVWETPWQPEHMPVNSVVMVKVAHMEPYQAVVLGHFRQDGTDWGVNLYTVEDGSWPMVNSGWIVEVKVRGDGGVVWENQKYDYHRFQQPVWAKKHHSQYTVDDFRQMIQTLFQEHPAFHYVNNDNHQYSIHTAVTQLHKEFGQPRSFGEPYAPVVNVSKRKFVKRLHQLLAKSRHSRKATDKHMAKLNEESMIRDMEADLD